MDINCPCCGDVLEQFPEVSDAMHIQAVLKRHGEDLIYCTSCHEPLYVQGDEHGMDIVHAPDEEPWGAGDDPDYNAIGASERRELDYREHDRHR